MSDMKAHTEVPAEGHHAAEPTAFGLDAPGWVALAMIAVFAVMIWKRVPAIVGKLLDGKIEAIRTQLANAEQLRKEAEAIKAEYEAKSAAAGAEAKAMIEHAREEAKAIVDKAKVDTAALIERRGKIAEDKIAAAERGAIAEVRAKAAAAAAKAAATIIAETHGAAADKPIVDKTIAGLARVN
jgi:F-type H+-transporting ATPase subunit b